MTVLDESPEAMALIAGAERVVAMGGYNTTLEALSLRKPTLLVPRVRPRREQAIRAERLAALGLVDVLHPGPGRPPPSRTGWRGRSRPRPTRSISAGSTAPWRRRRR
jgi:predicted glycosyltransferase